MYMKDYKSTCHRDIYISVSNAVLLKIGKLYNQSGFPPTDRRIKKIGFMYTTKFYSDIRKNEIMSFPGKMGRNYHAK